MNDERRPSDVDEEIDVNDERPEMAQAPYDVVVIGAGLAGLTAAATAAGEGARVVVIEAHHAGGRASATQRGAVRFNQGPHALYRGGAGWPVLTGLGISPRGLAPAVRQAHGLRNGEIHLLPRGALDLARTPLLRPRSRAKLARLLGRLPHLRARDMKGSATAWFDELDLASDARDLATLLARLATYVGEMDRLAASIAVHQMQMLPMIRSSADTR